MNTDTNLVSKFFRLEAAPGILLVASAIAAIVVANSPLSHFYELLIDTPVEVRVGELEIAKPLLLWVNDGLMAIFFLLVGLELKREFREGDLSEPSQAILPAVGAVGGMFIPAGIYVFMNLDDPVALKGWAIPAATDIAFALGVLALLGSKVPKSLKVFLTSLAIFDDVGAILIIAFFYTSKISMTALGTAFFCTTILFVMNRFGVVARSAYLLVGLVMWTALLKSGVHATLAGVLLALFIPMRSPSDPESSPLKSLEHDLHGTVSFLILPVFAFCNSGINFAGMGIDAIFHDVSIGIALGLFFGKQIGVFGLCWLAIKLGWTKLPSGASWGALYGTAALCGIGFTMSLFIGSLAFEETGVNLMFDERVGILLGSFASGLVGYLVLRRSLSSAPAS